MARAHSKSGNLRDDGTRLYTYDYKNRLVGVFEKASSDLIAVYLYDAGNRRTRKTVVNSGGAPGTTETRFFYDGWRVCEEQTSAGATLLTYVYSPVYIDEPVQILRTSSHPAGAGAVYLHQNARADVVAVTDASGAVVERRVFDDFGRAYDSVTKLPANESLVGNPYGFHGRRLDAETGLYYYRNRYLDPRTGRFLQRDPVWDAGNFGGQYSFAWSGPISRVDPHGLRPGINPKTGLRWRSGDNVGSVVDDLPSGQQVDKEVGKQLSKQGGKQTAKQTVKQSTKAGLGRALGTVAGKVALPLAVIEAGYYFNWHTENVESQSEADLRNAELENLEVFLANQRRKKHKKEKRKKKGPCPKSIALGLVYPDDGMSLEEFAAEVGAFDYQYWHSQELTSTAEPPLGPGFGAWVEEAGTNAITSGGAIHFSLAGMDGDTPQQIVDNALESARQDGWSGGVTNMELDTIAGNDFLADHVQFYDVYGNDVTDQISFP